MTVQYPIKVKASADFINELSLCENGRYEDALTAREEGDEERIRLNRYDCTFGDFAHRYKTQIEVRNRDELYELWYALTTGTIGVRGYYRQANRILDDLRDVAKQEIPDLVRRHPTQSEKPDW